MTQIAPQTPSASKALNLSDSAEVRLEDQLQITVSEVETEGTTVTSNMLKGKRYSDADYVRIFGDFSQSNLSEAEYLKSVKGSEKQITSTALKAAKLHSKGLLLEEKPARFRKDSVETVQNYFQEMGISLDATLQEVSNDITGDSAFLLKSSAVKAFAEEIILKQRFTNLLDYVRVDPKGTSMGDLAKKLFSQNVRQK